ncbi:MAG: DUF2218 domain-containing protein [Caenispirillum sp.]|nr:DUF2218 domain-containing protein [Caenispirillum sp.]
MRDDTFAATGRAATPAAAKYLGQLCKHFAHKITVDYDAEACPDEGLCHFPWGTCRMTAEDGGLTVAVTAASPEGIDRIRAVVDDHLGRFAWREKLALEWRPAAGGHDAES